MGSWFSSPRTGIIAQIEEIKEYYECINGASEDAYCIRDLAYWALSHYNSIHPGTKYKFRFPAQPSTIEDMKAACVGFRKDLWYHVNFSACCRTDGDDDDGRTFFAELCYDNSTHCLIVRTCAILEKPFRSSSSCCCTLCPDESKILHPDDAEFMCGKEGHDREFFSERRAPDGTPEFFSRRDMLRTPFLLGGPTPRYRLVDDSP